MKGPAAPPRTLLTEVARNGRVARDTYCMAFRAAEIAGRAGPGRFLMVSLPALLDPFLPRPFAVYRVAGDRVEILYRRVGRGTGLLAGMGGGDPLRVTGPLGNGFDLSDVTERPLVIAGGMGIASVRLLLDALVAAGCKPRLLYGLRRGDELVPLDGLVAAGVEVRLASEDGAVGERGTVGFLYDRIREREGDPARIHGQAFVCGPPVMMRAFAERLEGSGIRAHFSLEARMACGFGVCQGCSVPSRDPESGGEGAYRKVCVDGPVFPMEAIAWERTGAPRRDRR